MNNKEIAYNILCALARTNLDEYLEKYRTFVQYELNITPEECNNYLNCAFLRSSLKPEPPAPSAVYTYLGMTEEEFLRKNTVCNGDVCMVPVLENEPTPGKIEIPPFSVPELAAEPPVKLPKESPKVTVKAEPKEQEEEEEEKVEENEAEEEEENGEEEEDEEIPSTQQETRSSKFEMKFLGLLKQKAVNTSQVIIDDSDNKYVKVIVSSPNKKLLNTLHSIKGARYAERLGATPAHFMYNKKKIEENYFGN